MCELTMVNSMLNKMKDKTNMKVKLIKSAWLLAAGAIFALSVAILNSCSSDDDYDMYMGDELRTHVATTRSASAESGGGSSDEQPGIHYQYSINAGETTNTQYISSTGNFSATVKFEWSNSSDAADVKVTATCTFDIPDKDIIPPTGPILQRKKYYIKEYTLTEVIPTISGGYGTVRTDLSLQYQEILYTTGGEFYGYGNMQYYNLQFTSDISSYIVTTKTDL